MQALRPETLYHCICHPHTKHLLKSWLSRPYQATITFIISLSFTPLHSPSTHPHTVLTIAGNMSEERGRDQRISTGRGGAGNLVRSLSRGPDPDVIPGAERGRELRDPSVERVSFIRVSPTTVSPTDSPGHSRWPWWRRQHSLAFSRPQALRHRGGQRGRSPGAAHRRATRP